tara:strand:+ start:6236 stop:7885 length:1650 start_codon:yes stop_codon:yes gene_type:complete
MAKTVDQLIVEIKADTKDLQSKLKNIQGRIGNAGKTGSTAFVPMIGSLRRMLPLLASVGAGLLAIGQVRDIARVGSEFEDMKDSLNQVFGSINRGTAAFNQVLKFAQTTPFQIEDVTRAFISLKGAGIEPNLNMLQTFADTASTSIDQLGAFNAMVRLVQRSAAGGLGLEEINQLDDRGIPATKILTDALGVTRLELSKFGQTAEGAAHMVDLLIQGMEQRFGGAMENKMDNLSTKTSNMTIAFKELKNAIFEGGLDSLLKGLADELTRMASASAMIVRAAAGIQTIGDLRIATGITESDPVKALDEARKRLASLQETSANSGSGLTDTMQFATMLADQDKIANLEKFIILLEESLPKANQTVEETTKKTTKAMTELDNIMKEGAQTLSREFTDALIEGESVMDSFKNFAKMMVSEIIATFLRLAVIEPILNSVFSAVGLTTGGGGTPAAAASGGRAAHGQAMLVGERGPELFVPHTPGRIMNAADTRSVNAGGGVVINQSVNFSTGLVPTVRAEVRKLMPQISDVTKAAVLESTMRGGSFQKGIRGKR